MLIWCRLLLALPWLGVVPCLLTTLSDLLTIWLELLLRLHILLLVRRPFLVHVFIILSLPHLLLHLFNKETLLLSECFEQFLVLGAERELQKMSGWLAWL